MTTIDSSTATGTWTFGHPNRIPERFLQVPWLPGRFHRYGRAARTAEGEERWRLWDLMADVWPAYNDYQRKTSRQIPVVVFERA